jgi:hypothetical protein
VGDAAGGTRVHRDSGGPGLGHGADGWVSCSKCSSGRWTRWRRHWGRCRSGCKSRLSQGVRSSWPRRPRSTRGPRMGSMHSRFPRRGAVSVLTATRRSASGLPVPESVGRRTSGLAGL